MDHTNVTNLNRKTIDIDTLENLDEKCPTFSNFIKDCKSNVRFGNYLIFRGGSYGDCYLFDNGIV